MGSLPLSKEYGVNPSVVICFYCHESVAVALFGANNGRKAPPKCIMNYEPCPACIDKFKVGVLVLEVRPKQSDDPQPEVSKGMVPTGNWWVLSPDALVEGTAEPGNRRLITKESAIELGLPRQG